MAPLSPSEENDVGSEVPPPSQPTAASQCLSTVELLENVLLALPILDIVSCQMVCRQWRDVVACSLHLQRAILMEPPASGPVDVRHHETEYFKKNPMAYPGTAMIWDQESDADNFDTKIPGMLYNQPEHPVYLKINPLVNRDKARDMQAPGSTVQITSSMRSIEFRVVGITRKIGMLGIEILALRSFRHRSCEFALCFYPARCQQPKESWMKMFLMYPPFSRLILKVPGYSSLGELTEFHINFYSPAGVTIGDVVKAIEDVNIGGPGHPDGIECVGFFP
ncbi:hypothetical protein BU16DRAFT_615911 [Lophium mytilinum]|uniref:F-box domain-containing protein n=1 Tax=Lophium mytilinum TaxID=390894 RepID=A0A6A6R364_9PEZI|nr:hypothetical protein BU16DRAFT_615911 [Lophium mytilinum]